MKRNPEYQSDNPLDIHLVVVKEQGHYGINVVQYKQEGDDTRAEPHVIAHVDAQLRGNNITTAADAITRCKLLANQCKLPMIVHLPDEPRPGKAHVTK